MTSFPAEESREGRGEGADKEIRDLRRRDSAGATAQQSLAVEALTKAEREELQAHWSGRVGRIPANGLRLLHQLEQAEQRIEELQRDRDEGWRQFNRSEIARIDVEQREKNYRDKEVRNDE